MFSSIDLFLLSRRVGFMAVFLVSLTASAQAQETRLLLQVGLGVAEADGLLNIPFVAENAGSFSRPQGADNSELVANASLGYRVYDGLFVEAVRLTRNTAMNPTR